MRTLTFLAALLLAFCSRAQNYKQDVINAYKTLSSATSYSLCMEYRLYLDGNTVKPYEVKQTYIQRNGTNMRVQQGDVEMLSNASYDVLSNSKLKVLTVNVKQGNEKENETKVQVAKYVEQNLDTTLTMFESIKIISDTKQTTVYECICKPGSKLKKAVLTINKKTGLFDKIVNEFRKPIDVPGLDNKKHSARLEIRYIHFSTDVKFDKSIFSSSPFIQTAKNGTITPTPAYSNYKFILSK